MKKNRVISLAVERSETLLVRRKRTSRSVERRSEPSTPSHEGEPAEPREIVLQVEEEKP